MLQTNMASLLGKREYLGNQFSYSYRATLRINILWKSFSLSFFLSLTHSEWVTHSLTHLPVTWNFLPVINARRTCSVPYVKPVLTTIQSCQQTWLHFLSLSLFLWLTHTHTHSHTHSLTQTDTTISCQRGKHFVCPKAYWPQSGNGLRVGHGWQQASWSCWPSGHESGKLITFAIWRSLT